LTAKRYLPLTAVLAVAAVVGAFLVGGETPDTDDSLQKITSFYTENDDDQQLGGALLAYAAVFFLIFAATLRSVLRRAEGDTGGASALSFAGAIIFAAGLATFAAISFTVGSAANDVEPQALQALHVLNNEMFFIAAVGLGVFLLGTGVAILKGAALPKWFGWLTVALGVIAITPIGWIAFLGMGLWLLIAAALLWVTPEKAPTRARTRK
jgi:hypothetical protein